METATAISTTSSIPTARDIPRHRLRADERRCRGASRRPRCGVPPYQAQTECSNESPSDRPATMQGTPVARAAALGSFRVLSDEPCGSDSKAPERNDRSVSKGEIRPHGCGVRCDDSRECLRERAASEVRAAAAYWPDATRAARRLESDLSAAVAIPSVAPVDMWDRQCAVSSLGCHSSPLAILQQAFMHLGDACRLSPSAD